MSILTCLYLTHFLSSLYRQNLLSKTVAHHIKTLNSLGWGCFAGKAFTDTIGCLKDEIGIVVNVLRRHHESLGADAKSKLFAKSNPKQSVAKSVPSAFKKSMSSVKLSDTEFHTTVDHATRKKKSAPGRQSSFAACVHVSVVSVTDTLRGMKDYEPLFITDDVMGIDRFGEAIGQPFLSPDVRCRYRENFRKQLAAGVENMCIHFYGKLYGGGHPNCIFVWKVPALHGPQHVGQVTLAIDTCREMAPRMMCAEAVNHYNAIMNNITDIVPAAACDALRNYLFMGEPNPDGSIANEYVEFIMNMADGQVCFNCSAFILSYDIIYSASFPFYVFFAHSYNSQSMCLRYLMEE